MPILTELEAANAWAVCSKEELPDRAIPIVLPAVDDYIKTATGKDWGADNPVDPTAKMLASVLFVRWLEDPGMVGRASDAGVVGLIGQLHAKALQGSG